MQEIAAFKQLRQPVFFYLFFGLVPYAIKWHVQKSNWVGRGKKKDWKWGSGQAGRQDPEIVTVDIQAKLCSNAFSLSKQLKCYIN